LHCRVGQPKARLIKKIVIVSCLAMIVTVAYPEDPCQASANTDDNDDSAMTKKIVLPKEPGDDRERTARFYDSLERLMSRFGEDHALWPENDDKHVIEKFLNEKDALTLNNCVFGRNLLGLGIGETSKDAEEALEKKAVDAWGNTYSLILAGSKHAPKIFETLYAIGVNRGVPLFNRDISAKVFVFLKADLHSLFADVFKNFNGASVLIRAREIHILGAPGSTETGYAEKIKPALCAADCFNASVYIGENDPVTTIISKSFRDKMHSLFGLVIPRFRGKERESNECENKEPPTVNVLHIKECGHDVPEYYPAMRKRGTTMLKPKNAAPDNSLDERRDSPSKEIENLVDLDKSR
jgi:hypothetical protein